ncbi:hypothetical protein N865_01900 [Intrasporangium oryzae NRRL B-24470]|uniref:Uncharacterized protein n=1 Tax=Intrasporangium oryzae NRRL B-24470 TaxID=1386089 RepID=W9GAX9_9MICO|nr:hypothetical protein [Intrasporangium oryzae]EWT03225.1 hypothetical protein N865_01900 [Intrasporangium oryzae NRRL B-24470]
MLQPGTGDGTTVTGRYRTDLGPEWWVAVVLVPAVLALIGAGAGILHVFLWSVVAFCIGTVGASAAAAFLVPERRAAVRDGGPTESAMGGLG